MFLISKCREDWDLGVRTISVLAFENRSAMAKSDFAASKHVVFRKSPPWLRIGAPNAYTEVLCTDLHLSLFYILTTGTYGKFARENTFFHFSCLWLESNLSNSCTQFPIVTVIQLLKESGVALSTDASVIVKWRLLSLLLRKKSWSSFVWKSQGAVFYSYRSEWPWVADCRHIFYFSQKKRHVKRKKPLVQYLIPPLSIGIYTCVLCTHVRIYVCQDLVHLDSSGPPGVSSRLLGSHPSTSSVQCACVCAYTHTHTHIHSHPP